MQLKTARIKRGIHIHASVNVVAAVHSQRGMMQTVPLFFLNG